MSEPVEPRYDGSEIAVVGMAGRFPGAGDLNAFWQNLEAGVESIAAFSEEEVRQAGEEPKLLANPDYVRARPILDGVELFDAAFFGFSPKEAEILDPQLRLFLECAWTALEHAGHDPERLPGRASLFAGASFSNYLVHNLYKNRPAMEAFGDLLATIYNVQDSLVTMVGYKLNLKGACCAVQTFCSTSLVGVHLACQNLLNYESDLALAGGVTVYVPQRRGYLFQEGGIVSRDGHCRAFDARADGTVFGNGLGVVVLRRLEDARKDGNTIHAVIRASAVNNDGSLKASFAAPGVVGQTEVVVEALSAADVDPSTIQYVEAHGTGTRLGDPAEVSALTKAFRTRTDRKAFCALGSVKTNVGHLDAAAGVAGLIKVILSLQHGRIPPLLHFETPNPAIDFASSPFYVNTSLREWPRGAMPRRAGVSAFGVGGTNAHVIVEEAPATTSEPSARRHQLLVLSAKTAGALDAAALRLAAHLEAQPELELSDVAYTLQLGRSAFAHRRIVPAAGLAEAVAALRSGASLTAICERRNPPVVLVLAGEGRIAGDAWRELYEGEQGFREAVTRCVQAASEPGRRTLEALCAGGAESKSALVDPDLEPLAIFVAEYALARLWKSWGLRFEAVIADGVGKLVAACLDGTMEVESVGLLAARPGSPGVADRAPAEGRDARPVPRALPADADRLYLQVGGCLTLGLGAELSAGKLKAGVATEGPPIGYRQFLELLGRLWLAGVEVDWAALHVPERRRRVPLPAYPFERQRFWVEPLKEAPAEEPGPAARLYRPVWKTAMPAAGGSVTPARWLVFVDSEGLGARIVEHLRASAAEVITVRPGRSFAGNPTTGYSLDPAQDGHYALLWDDLRSRQQIPDRVIHLWSLEPLDPGTPGPDRFRWASDLGFYSLLQLASTRPPGPLALHVFASGLYEVIGGETLAPEKAPLVALCRVLAQEEHDFQCALIDVEPPGDAEVGLSELLLAELKLPSREPVVAHRRGRRWVQDYEPIPRAPGGSGPSEGDHRVAPIPEGGAYLITGGLGNVGFVLGASLARQGRAKLVLTGRTALPPRERWSEWLADHEAGEATALRIQKVQALETMGAEVLVVEADAVSADDMRAAVSAARNRFGGLRGVIHAAGELAADTFLPVRELGREACERQFAPKVHGLFALDEALEGLPLDFCLLTSSLSSVLGGVGYAAYAGANAFMDALAARKCQQGNPTWVSVNWDQWEFGLPVEPGSARQAARKGSALQPPEGLGAFERILCLRGLDRVLVSAGPLASRLERWVRPVTPSRDRDPRTGPRPRPAQNKAYVSPRNECERILAGIWEELLGLESVGIHDNFFELGGHSLFAARALSRLREAFGVSLPLDAVFDAPTVAELAGRMAAAGWAKEGPGGPGSAAAEDRVEIEL